MFLDKTETFVLNLDGLHKRSVRKRLTKLCRQIQFCDPFQFNIMKDNQQYALEINIPKRQLPYVVSFLSFHNYAIYQIVTASEGVELLDSNHIMHSSKRFELNVDGMHDAFVKDKIIDIMTMLDNNEHITYTFTKHRIDVCCTPEVFSKLIYQLATHHVDVLSATYCPRVAVKRIS
ncbi:hypothetical protein I6I28_03645 [Staphylococcus pettenkoferi]|uniref:hypothetical protein n=1 Tax=Staphylococcus pettenkoferi TaxID=170573 RepID=UPI000CD299D2|nr:hypothetical protein [Staphylococcus pettenkoferi]PNZ90246.1 hypothetical protein CD126_02735 [Staphylococcus pettenkoferi]QQC37999.1 hypothetical protein I6I28_03645 [Staphylococcus pettenkoferi]